MKISTATLNGVFAVDKPKGPTSAFIVKKVKNLLFQAQSGTAGKREEANGAKISSKHNPFRSLKVGHGGTLDPLATGVLVIGIGKGTKSLAGYLDCQKEYEVTGKLGTATDTYDSEGSPIETAEYAHVTEELLQSKLSGFKGTILQKPPIYSALKRDGKPLYEYARENLPLPAIEPRSVTVHDIQVIQFSIHPTPSFSLRVTCGKGTYIRSLVHDLAKSMQTCAHVVELRRTRQGEWDVRHAVPWESLSVEKIMQKLARVADKDEGATEPAPRPVPVEE